MILRLPRRSETTAPVKFAIIAQVLYAAPTINAWLAVRPKESYNKVL
jgi:hypothetical protein